MLVTGCCRLSLIGFYRLLQVLQGFICLHRFYRLLKGSYRLYEFYGFRSLRFRLECRPKGSGFENSEILRTWGLSKLGMYGIGVGKPLKRVICWRTPGKLRTLKQKPSKFEA